MFRQLGHSVFCVGINSRNGASQAYRPSIDFSPTEVLLAELYEDAGGKYKAATSPEELVPAGFVGHVSAFVVMHDIRFIIENWNRIKHLPVIWRTIGQGVDLYDSMLVSMRTEGLKIVRYSEMEHGIPGSVGQDATIPFYKDPVHYGQWTGWRPAILTFANAMRERYPEEASFFDFVSSRVPCVLGGAGNENIQNAIGLVSFETQTMLYRECRAYLYCTGFKIPYTLNFIEAWMTGIPVIVYAPLDQLGPYYEIDKLLIDMETGFICRSAEEVVERCTQLQNDYALARRIGIAGRKAAIEKFGKDAVMNQWSSLFRSIEV